MNATRQIGIYEVNVSMELHELYHLIGLQNEIIQKLKAVREEIHLDQINVYLDQLMDGKTAAQSYEELKIVLAEDADNLKMLYCQLECARRVFDRYQEKHIPQTIYIESMKCFSRFKELLLNGGNVGRAYGRLCQARNCA